MFDILSPGTEYEPRGNDLVIHRCCIADTSTYFRTLRKLQRGSKKKRNPDYAINDISIVKMPAGF